jgi:hypothetical protein
MVERGREREMPAADPAPAGLRPVIPQAVEEAIDRRCPIPAPSQARRHRHPRSARRNPVQWLRLHGLRGSSLGRCSEKALGHRRHRADASRLGQPYRHRRSRAAPGPPAPWCRLRLQFRRVDQVPGAIGTPCSGPRDRPTMISASPASSAITRSAVTRRGVEQGSSASIRASCPSSPRPAKLRGRRSSPHPGQRMLREIPGHSRPPRRIISRLPPLASRAGVA